MESQLADPKGLTRKQLKGRKDRAEAKVKKSVREYCVERDGMCRMFRTALVEADRWPLLTALQAECDGPSQWAHLHNHRRAQTRGQAATQRHTTAGSLMLCAEHHQQYDAHQLRITALTRKAADGRLKFTRVK